MEPEHQKQSFRTTRWSVVNRSLSSDPDTAFGALATLCEGYWYPLYAFFRRSGKTAEDAEDLTQGFFAKVLEKQTLAGADRDKGKLRTFLLACARNHLIDDHNRAVAEKRGAGKILSIDGASAETRYAAEPRDDLTPDRLFQRRWALAVLESSLASLRAEWTAQEKAGLFAALRPFLGFGPEPEARYEEVCASLGMPLGTLKNHIFRLRQRWRELLFEQVSDTLDDPTEEAIKAELSELLGCV